MRNFFLPPEKWPLNPADPLILEGQEARHLIKVSRLKAGEQVRLLDGAGKTGDFTIQSLAKNQARLVPLAVQTHLRPSSRCFLAAAYTKAARRSWLMEKAVELEAGGIWFWQAGRSQLPVPEASGENWQAQLIAGAKQCSNPYLPEVRTFPSGAESLAREADKFQKAFLLWEDEEQENMLNLSDLTVPHNAGDLLFIMGPEGGLSVEEARLFKKHGIPGVSLGKRILRWETAALLCLGLTFWAKQLQDAQKVSP
ncbi:MAG: 16S rRNA (uracil(1498)-N(3))-methyltransferase [Deltaproteobacteria bacterium]|jgi:16S rRNA (uracil1498-N3)-methyltransferase|nr:16S rRNA (uracil(1498)-N(3))-methyltransferase [Deltaproteobacteria bacterium]